jgi:glycosyltransferase involved in cell wall biosynthesis
MRYLFVHQNFPAQYLHLVRQLTKEGGNEVVFLSTPNANRLQGVKLMHYVFDSTPRMDVHRDVRDTETAMRRAEAVAKAAARLKQTGFVPDIVVGHHGWGELLNIGDVYPSVPLLGYLEFFYRERGLDVGFDKEFPVCPMSSLRARNVVNLMALNNGGHFQTPTAFQRDTYPAWARDGIALIPEGVDLGVCRPDPTARILSLDIAGITVSPGEKLVTFLSRTLEPYRGFHVFMRALPSLLSRPDVRVVVVGGDQGGYGLRPAGTTWREVYTRAIEGRCDLSRVHFTGYVDYADHIRLLQRTDAHVYLTYPFVASWSLREALACGSPIVGSDTAPVTEFITDGRNGLLVPFFDQDGLASRILDLLADDELARHVSTEARTYAEAYLSLDSSLARWRRVMNSLAGFIGPAQP